MRNRSISSLMSLCCHSLSIEDFSRSATGRIRPLSVFLNEHPSFLRPLGAHHRYSGKCGAYALVIVGGIQNPLLVVLVLDAFLVQDGIHFHPDIHVLRDLCNVEQSIVAPSPHNWSACLLSVPVVGRLTVLLLTWLTSGVFRSSLMALAKPIRKSGSVTTAVGCIGQIAPVLADSAILPHTSEASASGGLLHHQATMPQLYTLWVA